MVLDLSASPYEIDVVADGDDITLCVGDLEIVMNADQAESLLRGLREHYAKLEE